MAKSPANLLDLNYRDAPAPRVSRPIIDVHTHVYATPHTPVMFEAADLYGIGPIVSMTPLKDVEALRRNYGDRLSFIAIPNWKEMSDKDSFREQWIADLKSFWDFGARLCKFWMAPRLRKEYGLTVDHPWMRPVVETAIDLGYEFMIHAGDPTRWFEREDKYADVSIYGTKEQQYEQVEWLLERIAPRTLIGAHMGGNVENLAFLQGLLDRHANYVIDTSATKWIVREVEPQPDAVREFVVRNVDRVLFGSDLVVHVDTDSFDHYASRYWCQRMMWESDYRGRSPIEDPDAGDEPRLAGTALPVDALEAIYYKNARRLGFAQ
jgi:hypothetical protein